MHKKFQDSNEYKFELKLSNGKSRKFKSGADMYNWARTVRGQWEFEEKEDRPKKK